MKTIFNQTSEKHKEFIYDLNDVLVDLYIKPLDAEYFTENINLKPNIMKSIKKPNIIDLVSYSGIYIALTVFIIVLIILSTLF